MKNDDIAKALVRLQPNAIWSLVGDDYKDLEWISTDLTKPTLAQIKAEIDNPTISAEAKAKAQAKAAAEGKLAALGLTTDDLRALGL